MLVWLKAQAQTKVLNENNVENNILTVLQMQFNNPIVFIKTQFKNN